MSRMGAMDIGIKPVWPSPRAIGSALTVWCHSGDNLMLHKSLTVARAGDIVVMNTQGNVSNSGFGGLLAASCLKIGIRAVIVDGTVRDSGNCRRWGFRFMRAALRRMAATRMAAVKWARLLHAAGWRCGREM